MSGDGDLTWVRPPEWLAATLEQRYGRTASSAATCGSAWVVETQCGTRYVWKTLSPRAHPLSLAAMPYLGVRLAARGIRVAAPVLGRDGRPLQPVAGNGRSVRLGYLQPWCSGAPLQMADRQQRLGGLAATSAMHATLRRDVPAWLRAAGASSVPLYQKMRWKFRFLQAVLPRLCAVLPGLQARSAELLRAAATALTALPPETGGGRAAESAPPPCVDLPRWVPPLTWCHRDLAPHNVLWREGVPVFIDFDQSAWDDPLGDVVQFCNHALWSDSVSQPDFFELLEVYRRLAALSDAEWVRLCRLAHFPDNLVRAAAEWCATPDRKETRDKLERAAVRERDRLSWLHQRA
ncbi:MAG: phosphotransferase [Alicyclobacillus sp.]|nr:phosphotransferase [Alicyclobacillus sp.]